MIGTNPGLAFAIANSWVFRKNTHPSRTARRLLRIPRRKAAAWLGFPDAENSVKILRKVHPGACYVPLICNLRRVLIGGLDSKLRNVLNFLPELNADVLSAINSRSLLALATPGLLRELGLNAAYPDRIGDWQQWLRDGHRMLKELNEPGMAFVRAVSVRSLERQHRAIVKAYNGRHRAGITGPVAIAVNRRVKSRPALRPGRFREKLLVSAHCEDPAG